jgi:hypothetical protein
MDRSKSPKSSTPRSRSPDPRDLNLKRIYDGVQLEMPLDVFARLNDSGVIVR